MSESFLVIPSEFLPGSAAADRAFRQRFVVTAPKTSVELESQAREKSTDNYSGIPRSLGIPLCDENVMGE